MARTSRYVIELMAMSASSERRVRDVTAPWREVQRARIVLYAARGCAISTSRRGWTAFRRSSVGGEDGSASSASTSSRTSRARAPRALPPQQVAQVVAVACELPTAHDRPLGRFSRTELHRLVIEQGVTEVGFDDLALAARSLAEALAAALVDLPARSRLPG